MPANDSAPPTPRYDEKTAQEAIALAARLQEEHRERMSREQVEAVAAEVGVEPEFVRAALAQVEAKNSTAPDETIGDARDQRRAARRGRNRETLAGNGIPVGLWWALGWMLPGIAAILTDGIGGKVQDTIVPLMGILYVGMGIFLSIMQGQRKRESRRQTRLQQGVSREQLLETLFTVQSQLEQEKTTRAFLSIDVVGSTTMKQAASELASEYSFGQYRRWVEQQVRANHGQIQSSAGDGIMCVFEDEKDALDVANGLLADLPRFNREQNRLSSPFRIRCGVNVGSVAVDPEMPLGEWQSAVIDRAAVLQKQAAPDTVVVGRSRA